mgnify:CR=1 FL=1
MGSSSLHFSEGLRDKRCVQQSISGKLDDCQPDLIVLAGFWLWSRSRWSKIQKPYHQYPSISDPIFLWNRLLRTESPWGCAIPRCKSDRSNGTFCGWGNRTQVLSFYMKAVEVEQDDTPEIPAETCHGAGRWIIMPKAIDLIANGKVSVVDGRVRIDENK